jgi:hypothetical protein
MKIFVSMDGILNDKGNTMLVTFFIDGNEFCDGNVDEIPQKGELITIDNKIYQVHKKPVWFSGSHTPYVAIRHVMTRTQDETSTVRQ